MTKTNNEPTMYRQGDVLITRVDRLPELATELPRDKVRGLVLAEGEVTGHAPVGRPYSRKTVAAFLPSLPWSALAKHGSVPQEAVHAAQDTVCTANGDN